MGNTHSAATPRRRAQNKLSKPRTNNASTTTLLSLKPPPAAGSSNSQVTSQIFTTRYSDLPAAVAGDSEEVPRKRMSIFKLKSSQGKPKHGIETGVDRNPVNPTPVEKPVHHSWSNRSRSASATRREPVEVPLYIPPSQRPNRMSLQPTRPSQTSLRQSLADSSTSQSELVEDRRLSYNNGPPTSPLGPRTNSETDLYGPIRRRSLLQPGLATRKSFVEGDPRQSLPSQRLSRDTLSSEELQDYYYNPAKPTSSPLSNLAALRKRLDEPPGPRTETPNGMEYGHIGAFKLGSLRITNGAASPAPSIDRPGTSRSENGRVESSHGLDMKLGQRSNTFDVPSEKPGTQQSESPLRQSYERQHFRPLSIDTHLPLPDSLFLQLSFFITDSPTRSLDLAQEYVEDLALSPFSFQNSPLPSPDLLVTSKHTALEDDLFSAEARTPSPDPANRALRSLDSGYSGLASLRIRQELEELGSKPLAKADSGYSSNVSLRSFKGKKPPVSAKEAPPTPPKDAREPVSRMASSNYSLDSLARDAARRDISGNSQLSRSPLSRNASSEYSVASFPSTASDSTVRDNQRSSLHTSTEPTSRHASSNYSLESLPSTIPETKAKESEAAVRKPPPTTRRSPPPPVPSKSAEQIWFAAQAKSQVVVHPQPARRQTLDPAALAHGVMEGEMQRPAEDEVDPAAHWRIKKRPQTLEHPQLYTVQAVRPNSPALSIPPVPQEASRKLGERVDAFPVSSIPNTLKGDNGLRRTLSKETLGTIFSVGSAEHRDEPTLARLQEALPPVPEPELVLTPQVKAPVMISKEIIREAPAEANPSRRNTLQHPEPLPSLGYMSKPKAEMRRSLPVRSDGPEYITTNRPELLSTPIRSQPVTVIRASSEPSVSNLSRELEATPFVPQSVASALSSPTTIAPCADPVKRRSISSRESQGGLRGAYKAQESIPATCLQVKKSRESVKQPTQPSESASVPAPKPPVPARPKDPVSLAKRAYPPQAHEKFSRASMQRQLQIFENSLLALQQAPTNVEYGDVMMPGLGHSMPSQNGRVKSPPPVTMQTQRKLVPVNLKALPFQAPAPIPALKAPLQAPAPPLIARATNKQSPQPELATYDPWAAQKQFWATQRQSADVALKTRRSQDMSRAGSTRNSVDYQRPSLQPHSDDHVAAQGRETAMKLRRSIEIGRAGSAAPQIMPNVEEAARRSIEFHMWQAEAEQQIGSTSRRASLESMQSWHAWRNVAMQAVQQQQQTLSHRSSVESTQSFQSARSNSFVNQNKNRYTVPMQTTHVQMQGHSDRGSYDHTYGSHPMTQKPDPQYYDGYSDASETYEEKSLPRQLHHTSTEDMLVLKRLSSFRLESEERVAMASPNWVVHDEGSAALNGRRDQAGYGMGMEMGYRQKSEGSRKVRVGA